MTKKPILYSRLKSEKKRQRPFMGRWGKTGWQGKMGTLPKQIAVPLENLFSHHLVVFRSTCYRRKKFGRKTTHIYLANNFF